MHARLLIYLASKLFSYTDTVQFYLRMDLPLQTGKFSTTSWASLELTACRLSRAFERQEPSSQVYSSESKSDLLRRLDKIESEVRSELKRQGFEDSRIQIERMLNMRFEGTDTALMVLPSEEDCRDEKEDFLTAFKRTYKDEFGFLLDTNKIVVDDLKVRGIGKTFDSLGPTVFEELKTLKRRRVRKESANSTHSVYYDGVGRVKDTPIFLLDKLKVGDTIDGPAMVIDDTQTIVLIPGSQAILCRKHLYITIEG